MKRYMLEIRYNQWNLVSYTEKTEHEDIVFAAERYREAITKYFCPANTNDETWIDGVILWYRDDIGQPHRLESTYNDREVMVEAEADNKSLEGEKG